MNNQRFPAETSLAWPPNSQNMSNPKPFGGTQGRPMTDEDALDRRKGDTKMKRTKGSLERGKDRCRGKIPTYGN